MNQAWHIFQKDIRYLRLEIGLLLSVAAFYAWAALRLPLGGAVGDILEPLTAIAPGYLIARLIHAEAIPGENQFWITRPYRWPSLLTAKLMFLIVFINLPLMAAQALVLLASGFPLRSIVPGLLWTQLLFFVLIVLPLSVVATLTRSMVQFLGCVLAIIAFGYATAILGFRRIMSTPAPIDWLHDSILFVTFAVIGPPILYLQYRSRRTLFSGTLAVTLAICGLSMFLYLPWSKLFPIQSRLSKGATDVQLVSGNPARVALSGNQVRVDVPVVVNNLPSGARAQIEDWWIDVQAPDGRVAKLTMARGQRLDAPPNGRMDHFKIQATAFPDQQFLLDERGRNLTFKATFFLTVFGNTRHRTITLHRKPTGVIDGLQCYAGGFNQLECRSAFRWPARIISQTGSGEGKSALTRLISYSPFPSTLRLDPIVRKATNYYMREPLPADREVTIEVEEPIAYLRREIRIDIN